MKPVVALGADHGGFALKNEIKRRFADGYEMLDLGAHELNPEDDYPDFARVVAQAVASGQAWRGILICASGVGACVAANKMAGVRAGLCHDTYSSHQGVEHDDMNVLCLGAAVVGPELAMELVASFLQATYLPEEKYERRKKKVLAIERRYLERHDVRPQRGDSSPRRHDTTGSNQSTTD